jgi:hypothetical protein
MLDRLKYYAQRARELSQTGELGGAIRARVLSWPATLKFIAQQAGKRTCKEYSADLPAGMNARKITVRLSVPALPIRASLVFSEHVMDESGSATSTLLALATGAFGISHDLGRSWRVVKIKDHKKHRFVQIKSIGNGEFLMQGIPPQNGASKLLPLDLFVVDERGNVLVKHAAHSHRWHGCRAMETAGGTMMFAENISNRFVARKRPLSSRVWRSRDRGRTWQAVFEQNGDQIRHFHFLQPRPGHPGEWWLTSGDLPHECHVWITRDDGGTWEDVSKPGKDLVRVSGQEFKRDMFRLTDLFWWGDEVIWGTDDILGRSDPPGARVFRSVAGGRLEPELVGRGKWHFRNVVDIGDYLLFISQRSNADNPPPEDRRPGVYLVSKHDGGRGAGLVHLFDLESYPSADGPGFTFSKASRAAVNGTFFSYRSSHDVFPAGHRMLEWNVRLE